MDDEYLNGYARLCGIYATGVYCSLCRHANKNQTCFPSKELISEELAISERAVYTAIKKLQEWNLIKIDDKVRKPDGTFASLVYTLIDKKHWKNKPTAYPADGMKQHQPSANHDTIQRHTVPSKETHIEGNTSKETHIAEKNKTIKETIDLFKFVNEFHENIFKNKTERKAIEELLDKKGKDRIKKVIDLSCFCEFDEYFPKFRTPYELQTKWSKIQDFYARKIKFDKRFEEELARFVSKKNKELGGEVKKLSVVIAGVKRTYESN